MNEFIKNDLAHIWHPCTQMKDHEFIPLLHIARGEGAELIAADNQRYIDCISSWWVNLFGHCNDYISDAVAAQARTLEHVLLAGATHEGVVRLSERLCGMLAAPLNKCFYADNGSSAIEVALKMSFHRHALAGRAKSKFIALANSYHGETIAALSVSDTGLYKKPYEPLCFGAVFASAPSLPDDDIAPYVAEFKALLAEHGGELAALIIEPLIQCAGGMRMHSPEFARAISELAREAGVDVIYDEIAVGFGRTGSMFAHEQIGFVPDFLCLSKGITGGYLPLSVVVTNDEVYEQFYAPYEAGKAFLHSHSYTGSALACAAANAVLDIFARDEVIARNRALAGYIWARWRELGALSCVSNVRSCGMVFALEVDAARLRVHGAAGTRAGIAVYLKALERGLLLRPLGNTIYFMPPYVISHEQVDYVTSSIQAICGELFR